jgi:hypothetical protein
MMKQYTAREGNGITRLGGSVVTVIIEKSESFVERCKFSINNFLSNRGTELHNIKPFISCRCLIHHALTRYIQSPPPSITQAMSKFVPDDTLVFFVPLIS